MATAEAQRSERVRLDLEGMSCASCAARIERKLNELDGVTATVNLASEQAAVAYDPGRVTVDDLLASVSEAGYGASVESAGAARTDDVASARARLVLAALLTV